MVAPRHLGSVLVRPVPVAWYTGGMKIALRGQANQPNHLAVLGQQGQASKLDKV